MNQSQNFYPTNDKHYGRYPENQQYQGGAEFKPFMKNNRQNKRRNNNEYDGYKQYDNRYPDNQFNDEKFEDHTEHKIHQPEDDKVSQAKQNQIPNFIPNVPSPQDNLA